MRYILLIFSLAGYKRSNSVCSLNINVCTYRACAVNFNDILHPRKSAISINLRKAPSISRSFEKMGATFHAHVYAIIRWFSRLMRSYGLLRDSWGLKTSCQIRYKIITEVTSSPVRLCTIY